MTTAEKRREARVVVGIDGSPDSDEALREAAHEAVMRDAQLDVVLVWSLPFTAGPYGTMSIPADPEVCEEVARRLLDDRIHGILSHIDERPRRVERILVNDHSPSRMLVATAKNADLLVVGSRGRGGFASLLLGSVSHQCVNHATCPVLVVRSTTD